MNHLPEEYADDHDLPPPREPSPGSSPLAVSFGDAIHHHYYDNNAEPREQSSSSSSDSDSDDEDGFFQLEASDLSGPSPMPPTAPAFVDNETSQSAKHLGWKPPPAVRYDVPDPNRIPMSVFARNPATASPKDWSVASNESLFSIQMGNSSFSREQGLFIMGRSGELGNFPSGPLDYPPPRPPPGRPAAEAAEPGGKAKLVDLDEVKEDKEEEAVKEEAAGFALSHSISRQSDSSSTTSFGSFAFPVLAGEEKGESIKVMLKQHAEHRPPPLITPLKAPSPAAATAPVPTRTLSSATSLASAKRRWFPCFSSCQLCF